MMGSPGAPDRACSRPDPEEWRESTARKYRTGADRQGRGRTLRDGDLRRWTRVDVLPVVCKQGVRGSSPLSSTGQKQNSNRESESTAAKYRNRDHVRCQTPVRAGARSSRVAAACGGIESRSWAWRRATEQEECLRQGPAGPVRRACGQRAESAVQCLLLPLVHGVSPAVWPAQNSATQSELVLPIIRPANGTERRLGVRVARTILWCRRCAYPRVLGGGIGARWIAGGSVDPLLGGDGWLPEGSGWPPAGGCGGEARFMR
jgi:hypothetical protein